MFWLMPLISGLGTWAATGDFKKGLMSGLLGAGIGGIAGAFGNAASGAASAIDVGKNAVDVANLAKGATDVAGTLGTLGQGAAGAAAAGSQGIQAIGQAAGQGGSGVLQAGADFLARKPVTSGLMLSALTSSMMPPEVAEQEQKKGERFKDEMSVVPRETLPFTGQPPPGPSTYVRNEPFTPDNPYRYGQYEKEKMFFDNPGLARAEDGGLPPLPSPGGSDERDLEGILGIIRRGRGRQAFAGGGRIRGPGDGQSDNVPARGPGMDILLSDGEFVIPADVVSALGAGSTDAGAKRLENAMSKIRTMSYGSSKQARRPGRVSL